jgi:hypothetical protein
MRRQYTQIWFRAIAFFVCLHIAIHEEISRLPNPRVVEARISLPSDRSFESSGQAFAHVTGSTLPNDTDLYWDQTMLDVLPDSGAGALGVARSYYSAVPASPWCGSCFRNFFIRDLGEYR